MKRILIIFLLGILFVNSPVFAGGSKKPSIPTKLVPAPVPSPPLVSIPPKPLLKPVEDCRWVEQPVVYNNTASTFYGGMPIGVVVGYGQCAVPIGIPGGYYRPAVASTTKGSHWICNSNKGENHE
jgi:hypothetical protein